MPKFTFECSICNVRFTRTLKMGEHPDHPCPSCKQPAPRHWPGEGFAFDFAEGGHAPANSGVTKHDYPTADQAVGRSAEKRWAEYAERDKVKAQVREVGGTHALNRTNSPEKSGQHSYIQYTAIGEKELKERKETAKALRERDSR
jgi:putative FmdB family regulatory protein